MAKVVLHGIRLIGLLEIPAPELQCWTLSVLGNVAMAEASSQSGSALQAAVPAIVTLLEAWHQVGHSQLSNLRIGLIVEGIC